MCSIGGEKRFLTVVNGVLNVTDSQRRDFLRTHRAAMGVEKADDSEPSSGGENRRVND